MRLPRGLLCSYQAHKVSLSRRPFLRLYAASPDAMSARPPEAVADAEVLAELTSPVVLDVRVGPAAREQRRGAAAIPRRRRWPNLETRRSRRGQPTVAPPRTSDVNPPGRAAAADGRI
mmetsp:Transcript_32546/g.100729  ORF Transcript_32546/g.100729 Transcript_32546/m.100729 type:complete len:118 (+) Transcript_32546:355-708(+)